MAAEFGQIILGQVPEELEELLVQKSHVRLPPLPMLHQLQRDFRRVDVDQVTVLIGGDNLLPQSEVGVRGADNLALLGDTQLRLVGFLRSLLALCDIDLRESQSHLLNECLRNGTKS